MFSYLGLILTYSKVDCLDTGFGKNRVTNDAICGEAIRTRHIPILAFEFTGTFGKANATILPVKHDIMPLHSVSSQHTTSCFSKIQAAGKQIGRRRVLHVVCGRDGNENVIWSRRIETSRESHQRFHLAQRRVRLLAVRLKIARFC